MVFHQTTLPIRSAPALLPQKSVDGYAHHLVTAESNFVINPSTMSFTSHTPHLRGGARPSKKGRNVVQEFNNYFGNQTKLENWQKLCNDLRLSGDISSITKCKKLLERVWVNIWDLLDAVRDDALPPRLFNSKGALMNYTLQTNRFFPLKKAKEGGPVRKLLVDMC